jgi:nicotinamidase-related amidase
MQEILVVVDMQNDFIDGVLGTAEAVAIVPKVAKKIQSFPGQVLLHGTLTKATISTPKRASVCP